MSVDSLVGQKEYHYAIVTRVLHDKLKEQLKGAVYFKSSTLTGGTEYGEPAIPSFPLAGANGEGFFWCPQIGDMIEVEIDKADEHPVPKIVRALYSSEDDMDDEFKRNYPKRMGWRTRTGNMLLFDNELEPAPTPDSEAGVNHNQQDDDPEEAPQNDFVMLKHRLGTGFNWNKNGDETKVIVRDLIETIGREVMRTVTGKVLEKFQAEVTREITGKLMETIKNDVVREIQGNLTETIKGEVKQQITKDFSMIIKGKNTIEVTGNCEIKCADAKIEATGKADIKSGDAVTIESASGITLKDAANTLIGGFVTDNAANVDPITGIPLQPIGGVTGIA
jgi:hypothetical protein